MENKDTRLGFFSRGNCTAHPRPPDGAVLTGHGADPPHRIRQVRASCRESSDKLMKKQAQDHVNWVSELLPCCGSFSVTEKLLCSSAPPVYLCPGRVKSPFSAARTWSHWWNWTWQLSLSRRWATGSGWAPSLTRWAAPEPVPAEWLDVRSPSSPLQCGSDAVRMCRNLCCRPPTPCLLVVRTLDWIGLYCLPEKNFSSGFRISPNSITYAQ